MPQRSTLKVGADFKGRLELYSRAGAIRKSCDERLPFSPLCSSLTVHFSSVGAAVEEYSRCQGTPIVHGVVVDVNVVAAFRGNDTWHGGIVVIRRGREYGRYVQIV